MTPQLLVSILSSECSLDDSLQRISRWLPSIALAAQEFSAIDAPVQTLATEDTRRNSFVAARTPSATLKHLLKWVFKLSTTP